MNETNINKSQKEDCEYKIKQIQIKICILEANKKTYSFKHLSSIETLINAKIKGIYGFLAQLANVKHEYIDAIDAALGAFANYIVVDSQDTAFRAINVLRSSIQGRASFIPLDTIKKAPLKLPAIKEKGIIDYAINLTDFSDEYIDAFYLALSDTVVIEDEATVKKLAGKYRMVTLDGHIIEKNGLITGGARKHSFLFGKYNELELEKHKKLLKELKKAYVELNKR